ncbi:MAG: hypothetical protein K0R17_82 [Rariglobus sp.]|jgi:hypothetical protein|nr:hypothetical protein [Rariglobus sp.]
MDILQFTTTQYVLLTSTIVLLLVLLYLRPPATLTLSTDEKGRLSISRHALHRLIETCCEQLRGVASARAAVSRRGGKFAVTIHLKVRPNAKLDAIQGYLTQEIGDIFRENLGIGAIGPVEVKVIGVTPEPATF